MTATRVPIPVRSCLGARRVAGSDGPSVRSAARWRVGMVVAWVVGAIGAVAPTAFLGEPAAGLGATPLLGLMAVAVVAPVLIAPLVASGGVRRRPVPGVARVAQHRRRPVASDDRASRRRQPGPACACWWSAPSRGWWPAAGRRSAGPIASASGFGVSRLRPPLVVAAVLVALSWVLGALVGAWAVSTLRTLVVLVVGLMITGAVASLLYFAPGLRPAFWLTPWAALWPFDPQSFDSTQFATSVPIGVRLLSGSAWLVLLAGSAVRRRRRVPYPIAGESRRSHR